MRVEKPDYAPTAEDIRRVILDTMAERSSTKLIGGRDDELATTIASAVLTKLASLDKRRKHAQKFDIVAALTDEFIRIFPPNPQMSETIRHYILGILRENVDSIYDVVIRVLNDEKII